MLTVSLGFERSGKSRTWSPLGNAYSVMPSMDVSFWTPSGKLCGAAGSAQIRATATNASRRFRRIVVPRMAKDYIKAVKELSRKR